MRATIGNYNDDGEDTLSHLAESVDLTWAGGTHHGAHPPEGLEWVDQAWAAVGGHGGRGQEWVGTEGVGGHGGRGQEWVDQDGAMVLDVAPIPGRIVLFLSGAVEHAVSPFDGAMVLDVAPIPGRMVLFLSGAVEHAVTPFVANTTVGDENRPGMLVSVTAWFS
eukprot:gene27457-4761_t